MSKEIWLPVSQTKVSVVDGVVKVWDEMTMSPKIVSKPKTGFTGTDADE